MSAYDNVKKARDANRPTASAYIARLFDDVTFLHGDRRFADDPAVLGGIGRLNGLPVTFIGIERGTDLHSRIRCNFGSPKPEGYRKALRLMGQAEKFNRPVVCLVDTAGAHCGVDAEERGQGQAIAENLCAMMGLSVPVVAVVIGEGGSGGALALAVADKVYMLENAVYSVISPEGCASILWKDAKMAPEAAERLRLTAFDAWELGMAEEIIPEDFGHFPVMCKALKASLADDAAYLSALPPETLTDRRYQRFRRLGVFMEDGVRVVNGKRQGTV